MFNNNNIVDDLKVINENTLKQSIRVIPSSATLLGAPLSSAESLASTLDIWVTDLGNALEKLQLIARQDALLILRYSLGSPRLMHVLRSTPCHGHPRLGDFD